MGNPSWTGRLYLEELGVEDPTWESLDTKVRATMSKHTQAEAEKNKDLVKALEDRRDEMKMESPPSLITGRQLLLLVRQFYQIHANEKTQFELSALMDLGYPGDERMAPFKRRWN